MRKSIRNAVRGRAGGLCEYCHAPQRFSQFAFVMDHVIAQQHRGRTSSGNLAFACGFCNRHKGPNLSGVDPQSKRVCNLFNPRRQRWEEHFAWRGIKVIGKTSIGRATVVTLNMNSQCQHRIRRALLAEGEFPPTREP